MNHTDVCARDDVNVADKNNNNIGSVAVVTKAFLHRQTNRHLIIWPWDVY